MTTYETLEHADCKIRIEYDEDPLNPREEFDHAGAMVCFHDRYNLGDKHGLINLQCMIRNSKYYRESWEDYSNDRMLDLDSPADLQTAMDHCHFIVLPLYLYDHSGITMQTGPFACLWDSGQVGFIYIPRENAIKEWGKKICTKKVLDLAEKYLMGEVNEYDQYLTGQVFGFIVEHQESGEEESCWGFFGADYCIEEAKSIAEYLEEKHQKNLKQIEQDRQHRLCALIRNHVPLSTRQVEMEAWT